MKAYISAGKCKPQVTPLSESREPANKKAAQKHHFVSTKKKRKKKKTKATLSKSDNNEKAFLLESLTGNVKLIFKTAVETNHDYGVGTGDRIAVEHSC